MYLKELAHASPSSVGLNDRLETHGRADVVAPVCTQSTGKIPSWAFN